MFKHIEKKTYYELSSVFEILTKFYFYKIKQFLIREAVYNINNSKMFK